MTKCYSVRLQSLISISDKAYKALSFDGREDIIPKSQVFGEDFDVKNSQAFWISAWILSKKDIQYSTKKARNFSKNGKMLPDIEITKHIPAEIKAEDTKPDDSLIR